MPDNEYKIKFTTSADTSGAKETKKELAGLTEEIQGSKKPMEEAAGATKELHGQKKVLKETIKELKHHLPGFGQLLLLLKNPITIVAGGIGILVSAFHNYLNTIEELAKSIGVHEAVSRTMFTLGGAARDAAKELVEFNQQLGESEGKARDTADQLGKVVAAIQKISEMEAEKRSAQEGLELAGVNEAERGGGLAHGDAIRQRAALKEKYIRQAEEAKIRSLEEQQGARKEALRNTMLAAQAAQGALPGAVNAATAAERAARSAPDKEKSDLALIEEQRKEWQGKLTSAQKDRSAHEPSPLDDFFPPWMIGAKDSPASLSAIDARIDEATEALRKLDEAQAMAAQQRKNTEDAVKPARGKVDDLKKTVTGSRDASGKLFEDILQGDTDLTTFRAHRRTVTGLEGEARGIEAGGEARAADREEEEKRQHEQEKARERQARDILKFHGPLSGDGSASGQGFGGSSGGDLAGAVDHSTAALAAYFATVERKLKDQARQIDLGRQRLEQDRSSMD